MRREVLNYRGKGGASQSFLDARNFGNFIANLERINQSKKYKENVRTKKWKVIMLDGH